MAIPDDPKALRLLTSITVHTDEVGHRTLRPGTYLVARFQPSEEMHARFCLLDDGRKVLGWMTAGEAGKAEKIGGLLWLREAGAPAVRERRSVAAALDA